MKHKAKTLVLGIGNLLKKDDGIGVHVIQYMQDNAIPVPDCVTLLDGGITGFDCMQYMVQYDKIVIVDALKIEDKPGSICRFGANHLVSRLPVVSLHELGVAEALNILRIKGKEPIVEVIGIVPDNTDDLYTNFSSSVAESIPKVVDLILDSITAY